MFLVPGPHTTIEMYLYIYALFWEYVDAFSEYVWGRHEFRRDTHREFKWNEYELRRSYVHMKKSTLSSSCKCISNRFGILNDVGKYFPFNVFRKTCCIHRHTHTHPRARHCIYICFPIPLLFFYSSGNAALFPAFSLLFFLFWCFYFLVDHFVFGY